MEKYKVIFEISGTTMTAFKTQSELADLLKQEGVHLISVNDSGVTHCRKKKGR